MSDIKHLTGEGNLVVGVKINPLLLEDSEFSEVLFTAPRFSNDSDPDYLYSLVERMTELGCTHYCRVDGGRFDDVGHLRPDDPRRFWWSTEDNSRESRYHSNEGLLESFFYQKVERPAEGVKLPEWLKVFDKNFVMPDFRAEELSWGGFPNKTYTAVFCKVGDDEEFEMGEGRMILE